MSQTILDMETRRYKANITAGALLVPESRKIAQLLLDGADKAIWQDAVKNQNLLQKRSIDSAVRMANLIKARLSLMDSELWDLVVNGDSKVAAHAVFAAAIKHCQILGDYLDTVVREQFQRLEDKLTNQIWEGFIIECMQRDPLMEEFPDSTGQKMRTNVHRILTEAGYLCSLRSKILQRVDIAPEVINYLESHNEAYVLRCIQV